MYDTCMYVGTVTPCGDLAYIVHIQTHLVAINKQKNSHPLTSMHDWRRVGVQIYEGSASAFQHALHRPNRPVTRVIAVPLPATATATTTTTTTTMVTLILS
jgi:hypothetical protein